MPVPSIGTEFHPTASEDPPVFTISLELRRAVSVQEAMSSQINTETILNRMDTKLKLATKHLESAQNSAVRMLAEYIQEHGGIINCSNKNGEHDSIYAYIWLGSIEQAVDERNVNCIYYDDDYEIIYMHTCEYGNEGYKDFEDIKDDRSNWYPLSDNEVLVVPTLYSILDAIHEYAENPEE